MKSVMAHQFSQVPKAQIQRSSFDRSHGYKTTFDSGYLIPIYLDEALPGDTANVRMTAFARLATPIHPFMDNLRLSTFFFEIPVRMLWSNWEKMHGAQDNPGDSTDFITPTISPPVGGWLTESLEDYFGLPTGIDNIPSSALFHRAYNKVYNDWFKDENLINNVPVPTDDGPDQTTDYKLLKRGKRHDYFTSALPWPQKGESVDLPLGTSATVSTTADQGNDVTIYDADTGTYQKMGAGSANVTNSTTVGLESAQLYADLSTATAATINQLRQSFQVQKMLERDARGGTRYIEILKAHFNVTSPDLRLQRSGYLGGGTTPININPVTQTSSTDATTPQGNLAAFGTVGVNANGFTRSFTEHTILLGLCCVTADLTYQQGLNRMFSRSTRYDYYYPALANIGEQTVLNKEIYAQGDANDDLVFGYQERWAEYRYKPSLITGKFRSTYAQSLDTWHLSQHFTALPTLGQVFIEEDPPIERVVAVIDEPEFLFDSYFKSKWARPMPLYGVPGLIDHF